MAARLGMKALSVWQPWCWAMFELPPERWKDIENRTWPAPWVKGKWIAIHAALRLDDGDAWWAIEEAGGQRPPSHDAIGDGGVHELVRGAIVGVVEVLDFVTTSSSPWFFGPVGWVLGQRFRLPVPVPCRGAQGLWEVPEHVEMAVREGVAEARRASAAGKDGPTC